ncbi:zinc metallochaperone AztD [Isoptericola jiangsuensis]|uniref:zinc metallochaperone AztD n=1 Tax=Isoptericola jiangsuensis TaxID=548579 RepID=UPI003AAD23FF
MSTRTRRATTALALALPLALVAACADPDTTGDEAAGAAAPSDTAAAGTDAAGEATEVQARTPRLAVTYDGGVKILDAQTLEEVGDVELAGFNRLNPLGDGRHLAVSTTGGFQVLDLGTWGQGHDDHHHWFTAAPALTDVTYAATTPGHVVVHDGVTAFFDDGTGTVQLVASADAPTAGAAVETVELPAAHHGVAVPLDDDTLVVTEGTEDERTGIRVLDAAREEIAASDECPGVHGETVAADEVVVVGCTDGALVVDDGTIAKVDTPDDYSRIGNQAGTPVSPIVLGDYKTDPDAELERPTRVSLVDTRDAGIRLVDLPASYTFRSLARGDDGEALVLTTDGALQVIDPESGEITASIPVIEPWEEPTEWQDARPAVLALDGSVYVTDPATDSIHAVDLVDQEVWLSGEIGVTPNEINGVTGLPEADGHEHADEHDHEADADEHDHEADEADEDDHEDDHDH